MFSVADVYSDFAKFSLIISKLFRISVVFNFVSSISFLDILCVSLSLKFNGMKTQITTQHKYPLLILQFLGKSEFSPSWVISA